MVTAILTAALDAKRRATREHVAGLFAGGMTGNVLASKIKISPRQLEVLRLTAQGLSGAEIADRLEVTEDTVKTHKRRINLVLGAINGTHAVAIAYKLGILAAFVSRCPACGWAPGQRTNGGAA